MDPEILKAVLRRQKEGGGGDEINVFEYFSRHKHV